MPRTNKYCAEANGREMQLPDRQLDMRPVLDFDTAKLLQDQIEGVYDQDELARMLRE